MPRELSPEPSSAASPRFRGEEARLTQQKKTIGDEIDVAVFRAGDSLDRPAEETYAAEVRQLSWSNPAIASALQAATAATLETLSAPAPRFCADARAWAKSGYRALSASSREFEASEAARRSSRERDRSVEALVKPYENTSDRALIRKINALANKLLASALASGQTVLKTDRIVGLLKVKIKEPKRIILGHGHTAAALVSRWTPNPNIPTDRSPAKYVLLACRCALSTSRLGSTERTTFASATTAGSSEIVWHLRFAYALV